MRECARDAMMMGYDRLASMSVAAVVCGEQNLDDQVVRKWKGSEVQLEQMKFEQNACVTQVKEVNQK